VLSIGIEHRPTAHEEGISSPPPCGSEGSRNIMESQDVQILKLYLERAGGQFRFL
jgi:hypothetical protein